MRLIDADALIGRLRKWGVPSDAWVIDEIKQAQTIDAVPVIRCEDCRFSKPWYRDKHRCFLWSGTGIDVFEDGFCNYAERKEE